MKQIQDTIFETDKVELMSLVLEKKSKHWRLCQICCAFAEGHYEVTYSFATGFRIENYRLIVEKNEEAPSISGVYDAAVFYENEMHELFGLQIEAMQTDLKDKLYRIEETTPFLDHLPPAPVKKPAPAAAAANAGNAPAAAAANAGNAPAAAAANAGNAPAATAANAGNAAAESKEKAPAADKQEVKEEGK